MTDFGAEEHLRAIRLLMERATIYRAISAPTALVGGLLSLVLSAAMLVWQNGDGSRNVDARAFYQAWLLVLLLDPRGQHFLYLARCAPRTRRTARLRRIPPGRAFRSCRHFLRAIATSGVLDHYHQSRPVYRPLCG